MTYEEKCNRFNQLRAEMKAILDAGTDGVLSKEQQDSFDKLAGEAKTLKAEILNADADSKRAGLLKDLDDAANLARTNGPSRDNPEAAEAALAQSRSDFASGRYSLRNFRNDRGQGHLNAYHAGLAMLARCGTGGLRDWATQRCSERSIDIAKLSPFQGEDGNSSGGYLVFPEFEATLINLKESFGVLQREAFKLPMASDTLIIPRRAGGTSVYYPGENTQITESAMAFDQVQLIAKKYAQMTRWSTELNEDSVISMADLLSGEMAYQFARAEDFNGAVGDGTATYAGVVGFLHALRVGKNGVVPTASLKKCATAGTTVGATVLADWEAVAGALPLYAEGRAKWYMHKTTFWAGPARLMDAAGGNIAMFLSSGAPLRFLGYDVVPMQSMPTAAAAIANTATGVPAVLGDMSMTSYMGTRRGVTVKTSDQRYIEFDQIAIQTTQRVAINNVVGDAVAPTTVAGPMVGLQLYF